MPEEGTARGKSEIVGEWAIRDKHGKIKEQGVDLPTQDEREGEEDEAEETGK